MHIIKCQMVFLVYIGVCRFQPKIENSESQNWSRRLLTNGFVCGLMTSIYSTKTLTENLFFLKAAESRRLVRADAEEWNDLIPESIL